jgi:hypothetical protein
VEASRLSHEGLHPSSTLETRLLRHETRRLRNQPSSSSVPPRVLRLERAHPLASTGPSRRLGL